jgi:hypothetical protein
MFLRLQSCGQTGGSRRGCFDIFRLRAYKVEAYDAIPYNAAHIDGVVVSIDFTTRPGAPHTKKPPSR